MVFTDAPATEQSNQNTDTTATESQQDGSYLQKIVEAKGDNWKDPEVLAKGKLEADGYIKNLEDQLSQMREDLKKQEYKNEVLDQLQTKAAETTAATNEVPNNNSSTKDQNTTANFSEEDLKSLVEKTLGQRELEAKVQGNLQLVDKELEGSFGTEAKAQIEKKATELGMSIERLRDIAAESPNAFFALIGENKRPVSPMVAGSVRTEGVNMQSSTERDFNYYQKLRRENRNLYYSAKTQQQMFEDKSRLGDKFGA
jgi:DNA polymerase III alpha subunit (gram-positive type)